MSLLRSFFCFFAVSISLTAETTLVFIDTVAGNTRFNNTPQNRTPFIQPQAIWLSPQGEMYVTDGNFLVWRLRQGVATVIAGGGTVIDDSVPVPALRAQLDFPNGITGGPNGELYISDVRHHRIRRINTDGTITTVAGAGTAGYSGDGGRATFAELDSPLGLVYGAPGYLYIADSNNYAIRRYDVRTGLITTVAGTGQRGYSGDGGPATRAALGWVTALALDSSGNLYLSDNTNYVVRKIATDGTITTVAGSGRSGFSGDDGPAKDARISTVHGMVVDPRNNLLIAEFNNSRIRRIDSTTGIITTIAGRPRPRNRGEERIPALEAFLDGPQSLAFDHAGNLYVAEDKSNLIRKIDAAGEITNFAGTLDAFDDGPAVGAPLIRPTDVAVDSKGNFYVADNGHFRVRRVDRETGRITTVAGNGIEAGAPGSNDFSLGRSLSISVDPQDRLLIADADQQVVFRFDPATGRLNVIADLSVDDSAPAAAVGDAAGNIYISDRYYNVIYKVVPGAGFSYLAGTEGKSGLTGDDGPATDALLDTPEGMVLDDKNGLIFCDKGNHVVRRIDLVTGIITRFAGDGIDDFNYDGHPAVDASLKAPIALTRDKWGYTYIADAGAHQIRYVDPDGYIGTVAGNGERGYTGDGGPAVLALFDTPLGIAAYEDAVYVCDSLNYRIRKLFLKSIDLQLNVAPRRLSFRASQGGEAPSAQLLVLQSSWLGLSFPWKLTAPGFSGDWLWASYLDGRTPDVIQVWVEPKNLAPGTYTADIIAVSETESGEKIAPDVRIPIQLVVDPPNVASSVRLTPSVMSFTVQRGGSDIQVLSVTSPGSNTLEWRARLLTDSPWLRFTATSGTTPSTVGVGVSAAALEPGTYYAVVYVETPRGVTLFVVSLVVSPPRASLLIDRDVLVFDAVEGSTRTLPQPVGIHNTGSGDLRWELAVPSDAAWVRAASSSGGVGAGKNVENPIEVDPSGLRAGIYSATLTLRSEGALGSPQLISVRLRVRPPETAARPNFSRTALVFRGSPGQQELPEQEIELRSTGGLLSYSASVSYESGKSWLDANPLNGSVVSSSQKTSLRFKVVPGELSEGVYNANVRYSFSDGTVQQVAVLLILKTGVNQSNAPLRKGVRAAECSPAQQVMVTTSLGNNFFGTAGWPIMLRAEVYDDCGTPLPDSTVTVSFSNNDPAKTLTNLRNGQYVGTWTPRGAAASVTLTMQAKHAALPVSQSRLGGAVGTDSDPPPVLAAGGVLNAASRRNSSLISPTAQMALMGSYFPPRAEDVQVLVNGSPVKVLSSEAGEIRVVTPQDFGGSPKAAVVVKARGISTAAEVVTVVPVDPGLFEPQQELVVSAGAAMTVTATGLGPANAEGKPITRLSAQVDDVEVPVESATASADIPGVYTLRIPAPAGANGKRQLTIKVNGVTSNSIPVTMQ